MPVTVADLLKQERLSLRCVASHHALSNVVRWVHVSEVDDPTPWLRGGEMLITTNLYGREESSLTSYFEALKGCGVAAVGYGTGWPSDDVPQSWRNAAVAAGLPLLEIPFKTPYIALSEFVAARQAEERSKEFENTLATQAELAASLLKGASEESIIDRLGEHVHGWAAIINSRGHLIHKTKFAASGIAAISGAVPGKAGHPPLSASTFVLPGMEAMLIPLGDGPEPLLLAVGREDRFDQLDRIFISSAASLIALAASQGTRISKAERRARTLVTESMGFLGLLDLYGFTPQATLEVALVIMNRPVLEEEQLAFERFMGTYAPRLTSVSLLPHELLMIAAPSQTESLPWDRLRNISPDASVGAYRDATRGEIEVGVWNATTAARRALALKTPFVDYAMLGNQEKLVSMFSSEARTEFSMFAQRIRTELEPEAIDALRQFLAHNGNLETASSTLGVHRQTLRARLQRAERRAGFSLASPDDRSILWLALRD